MLRLAAGALAIWILAAPSARAQEAQVEDIRVQLFYERSGTLSDDLTKRKELALHNTILGDGDFGEPADSFLVSVVVHGQPASYDKAATLTVTVTDDKKKSKLAEHAFTGGFLFSNDGRIVKPLFVMDRTCQALTITAKTKAGAKSVKLPFHCGE